MYVTPYSETSSILYNLHIIIRDLQVFIHIFVIEFMCHCLQSLECLQTYTYIYIYVCVCVCVCVCVYVCL